ncbi:MAG TPA: hypothetical protein VIH99_03070 [Bdellovibrionota bacterium]|jgi:Tfp pilus assembly protein PilF
MTRKSLLLLLLPLLSFCLICLAPLPAQAAGSTHDQKILADAFALFNKGAYPQAIEKAQSIHSDDRETKSSVSLFLGNTYSKMQAFDKASDQYAKALASGSKAPSIHYDYGQALFATQKLKDAESQFRKSIIKKFKMGASAYYIGYIRSVLDDKKGAKDFYTRIGKLRSDTDNVKQSALLQIAELAFDEANEMKEDKKLDEKRKAFLEDEVLGLYRRARDHDNDSAIAEQAQARIDEVESQLEQMVERMQNGNPLPRQRYTMALSQDFTYDTNVTTQADQALVEVSSKDALIWKTGVLGKYQFAWGKALSFIPELNASITYHSRRRTPEVFQNDNYSVTPAWRTKYEHWSGGKPATAQLDLEFNLLQRTTRSATSSPFIPATISRPLANA